MEPKLVDSELKVMNALWDEGASTAKHLSDIMNQKYGWNINTTYTIIKRCIKKGAIERIEPNFLCRPIVSREKIQEESAGEFLDKLFNGSVDKLFSALVGGKKLSKEEIENLKRMIDELDGE